MPVRLTDGEIVLRPWRDDDVDAVVRATADPEIPRWTRVPEHNTAQEVRAFFASTPPGEVHLAVTDVGTGELLGSIGLVRLIAEGQAEIGYWIAAGHRGRGVASRAVDLLATWALEERGLRRLEIHVHPQNAASCRVAEKAGFVAEGVLPAHEDFKGRPADVAMYARLAG